MIFSAAAVLSVATTALATLHAGANQGHSKHSPKLYAWADLTHPSSGVSGKIEFWGTMDGEPTYIKWSKLRGLNKAVSPAFGYHIHTNPVGPGGDCAKTLAHLDPLGVSPSTTCNPAFPQYCEEGDLSGKHGKLNATDNGKIAAFGYSDDFVRFYPQSHSILGRSVVIHAANTTRIACGNIISVLDGTADKSRKPTGKPSKYVTEYATAAPVAPTPVMIWSNGTTMPDEAALAALPRYLPMPALRLNEAQNVKLVNITHKVKFAGSEQEITQLKEEKVDEWDGKFSDECAA